MTSVTSFDGTNVIVVGYGGSIFYSSNAGTDMILMTGVYHVFADNAKSNRYAIYKITELYYLYHYHVRCTF